MDRYGLNFAEALARLEQEHGLDGLAARPAPRRALRAEPERETVDSATFGQWLWRHSSSDPEPIRCYLRARGVPEWVLAAERFGDLRFCPRGPVAAWRVGASPESVACGPALLALVRRPWPGRPGEWMPIGVHATFLADDLRGKAQRHRRDGSPLPARKLLGHGRGGCVLLGHYRPDAPLFVGEGIETVLSGLALAGTAEAFGLAALSLDNLQGHARRRRGALPLYAPVPDPERPPALAFRHNGPVTVLIDADMQPLRIGAIERAGGPVVQRSIDAGERAALCAALAVQAWRSQGCGRVRALRPRIGWDFNDMAREGGL